MEEAERKKEIREGKSIFAIDENVSFRDCSKTGHCTDRRYPSDTEIYLQTQAYMENVGYLDCDLRTLGAFCGQEGIHWHCTKHPGFELLESGGRFFCGECGKEAKKKGRDYTGIIFDEELMRRKAKSILNSTFFNTYNFTRIDDIYVLEKEEKIRTESGYTITTEVKKDKDGDTIVVLYIGASGKHKAQLFIKPEKGQLSYDHNDTDPATFLSKISVQFADREITHSFSAKNKQ